MYKRKTLVTCEKFTRISLLVTNFYSTVSNGLLSFASLEEQKYLIIVNAIIGGISVLFSYTNECLKNGIHNYDLEQEKPALKRSRSLNVKDRINTWIPFSYSM